MTTVIKQIAHNAFFCAVGAISVQSAIGTHSVLFAFGGWFTAFLCLSANVELIIRYQIGLAALTAFNALEEVKEPTHD